MTERWKAAAWFVLSAFALSMAALSLQGALHAPLLRLPYHWRGATGPATPAPAQPAWRAAVPSLARHMAVPTPAAPASAPPARAPGAGTGPRAGTRLLECSVHGQITYTNDPQACSQGSNSRSLTVYPTQGYEPYRR